MKTLTPYYGGKANQVGQFIAQNLPAHRTYVEPCGGMAGVLMQKLPSFQEVYNDVDANIVNLFRVVREPAHCEKLIQQLNLTPYARDEWKYCRNNYRKMKDPIKRARMVYVLLAMGYLGSLANKSFSFGGLKYQSCTARTFANGIEEIEGISKRLQNVIIENQDVLTICRRWDSPQTCIYLDPPYVKSTRKTFHDYAHEMTDQQHKELLEWCLQAQSLIIVSGYYTDLYASILEAGGWVRKEVDTYSRGAVSNGKGYKKDRVECVWFNPAAMDARRLPLFESLSLSN